MNKLHLIKLFGLTLLVLALVAGGWFLGVRAVSAQDEGPLAENDMELLDPSAVEAPVPGGPGFFICPASQLQPKKNTMAYEFGTGMYLTNKSAVTTDTTFYAPVHLPQGATIKKFTLYYYDNSATHQISASLFYGTLPGGSGIELAIAASSVAGASATYTSASDTTIATSNTGNIVDNMGRSYYVSVLLPVDSAVRVDGFRVDYAYNTTIPLTMR